MRQRRGFFVGVLLVALVCSSAAGAAPVLPRVPGGATPASVRDPRKPGDHAAEQDYLASLRLAPAGVSAAQARLTAVRQAAALPKLAALPASLDGQRLQRRTPNLQAPNGTWQPLGPATENTNTTNPADDFQMGISSGRGTAIVVGKHTGVLYLGTAGGGVWKSTNDGGSWMALTDNQPSLSVGALALDSADVTDNTLYVGTGEANNNGDAYRGVGVLKTTDGGQTWALLGSSTFGPYSAASVSISALVVNGSTIYAGTKIGLYQSLDGGALWMPVTVVATNTVAPVTDVQFSGTNLYVVLSSPFSTSPLPEAGVYLSINSDQLAVAFIGLVGFPGVFGRAQLAIAASNPQTMYIVIANNTNYGLAGLYRTTNGGAIWLGTSVPPDFLGSQGWYDLFIAVDPGNENIVYAGGTGIVASADGGGTWKQIANVYCSGSPPCNAPIHSDQHAAAFGSSGSPRPLYIANDGGTYKTVNGSDLAPTWTNGNGNLNITQFYAGDTTTNYLTDPVTIAGAQDNGTIRSTSASLTQWNLIHGGDGAFVGVDKQNSKHVYAEYSHGYFYSTSDATAGTAIQWTELTPSCQLDGTLFINPFAVDNANANHVLYAAKGEVCESVNGGATWMKETVSSSKATDAVAIAPGTSATMYAGTSAGVFHTTNGNTSVAATWSACGAGLPASTTNFVTSVTVPNAAPNTVYATLSGFGVHHVWKSVNCAAWQDLTNNLPNIPTTSLVQYSISGGTVLIVGTDIGVFVSTNDGGSWTTLMTGLPNVPVFWLYTDIAETTLFASTHGRGMWTQDIPGDFGVTSISSASGSIAGGNTVTIHGSGFGPGMTVAFDTASAGTVTMVDSRNITVTVPPHVSGIAVVHVVSGATTLTVPGGYTYGVIAPAPTPTHPTVIKSGTPNAAPAPVHAAAPTVGSATPIPSPVRH